MSNKIKLLVSCLPVNYFFSVTASAKLTSTAKKDWNFCTSLRRGILQSSFTSCCSYGASPRLCSIWSKHLTDHLSLHHIFSCVCWGQGETGSRCPIDCWEWNPAALTAAKSRHWIWARCYLQEPATCSSIILQLFGYSTQIWICHTPHPFCLSALPEYWSWASLLKQKQWDCRWVCGPALPW